MFFSLKVCKYFFLLLPLLSCLFQSMNAKDLAEIKKAGVLRVCSSPDFPPFEIKDSKGKWIGFEITVIENFAQHIGVKEKIIEIKWDGLIPALLSNKCDLIAAGLSKTPERESRVTFSENIYEDELILATLESSGFRPQSLAEVDKKDFNIAIKTGSYADLYLTKKIKHATLKRYDVEPDMVLSVKNKQTQAIAYDRVYIMLASQEFGIKFHHFTVDRSNHIGVAARKNDTKLIAEFNNFFNSWKKTKKYADVEKYFFKDYQWYKTK